MEFPEMVRVPRVATAAALVMASGLLGAYAARAQPQGSQDGLLPPITWRTTTTQAPATTTPGGPGTTPPTSPPGSSPGTTAPAGPPLPSLPGATTTTVPGSPPPGSPTDPTAPAAPPAPPGSEGSDDPGGAGTLPPGAQDLINSIHRSAPNNTSALISALQPLVDAGMSPSDAAVAGFGHFPVGGYASFIDDFLFPRFVPSFHFHQGTDIFAARGTPVRAPNDGVTRITNGAVGGLAAYVTQPDGTYFYMAHLDGLAPGIADGQQVKQGTVLGYVGDSGNARGGPTHCHFEIHPMGGPAVDPKSYLDAWVADAIAQAPALISAYNATRPRAVASAAAIRQFSERSNGLFAEPTGPSRSQLLWAASAAPDAGPVGLAQAEATAAASGIDWAARERAAAADAVRQQQQQAAVTATLAPLIPGPLKGLFGVS